MIVSNSAFESPPISATLSVGAVAAAALLPVSSLLFLLPGLLFAFPVLLAIPLLGLGVASHGWMSVRKATGELGGRRLAVVAMSGHAVALVGAVGWNVSLDRLVHPPGHYSISFAQLNRSPERIASVVGKNVVIGGWMHPMQKADGLSEFTLVDHLENNFGTYYKSRQQVLVLLRDSELLDHQPDYLIVTGRLETFDRSHKCPAGDCPKYTIHADSIHAAPLPWK